eukprot:scaffold23809_cov62-Cyclotella_meneghiniana.AAC.13
MEIPIPPNSNSSSSSSSFNQPTSVDITHLLFKLDCLETTTNNDNNNENNNIPEKNDAKKNIRLIELDPHHHSNDVDTRADYYKTTRLFLAVVFGKHVVVAQLFALELIKVLHDDDDDDEDEYEWVEISVDGNTSRPMVIFPPSHADALSIDGSGHTHFKRSNSENIIIGDDAVELTSCALIPPPSMKITCSRSNHIEHHDEQHHHHRDGIVSHRTVAVVLGTTSGQVLSILLHVSVNELESANDGNNITTSTTTAAATFHLRYEGCKNINGEKQKDKQTTDNDGVTNTSSGVTSFPQEPIVNQVLPYSKTFAPGENVDSSSIVQCSSNNKNLASLFDGDNIEAHIQVIHPSKTIMSNNNNNEQQNQNYDAILSISFGRGDWKFPYTNKKRRKRGGYSIRMNQDVLWVIYSNGIIVKMPSWKLFLKTTNENDGQTPHSRNEPVIKNANEGDSAAGNPIQKTLNVIVPIHNPCPSPLDIPPPPQNNRLHAGYSHHHREGGGGMMDFDEQSMTSKLSMTSKMSIGTSHSQFTVGGEDDYWGLLGAAVQGVSSCGQQQQQQQHSNQSIQAVVLGAQQSVPGSTLPLTVQSSRVECGPLSDENNGEGNANTNQDANNTTTTDQHHDTSSWASSSDDEHYGLVTGTVVGGTAALVKGALGAALGAVRWGFGGGAGVAVDDSDLMNDTLDEVDVSLDVPESEQDDSQVDDEDHFDIGSNKDGPTTATQNYVLQKGETMDLLPWPLCSTSLLFSDVPRRFENAVVEPSSSLMATTDNLGRVILFDLETQLIIRMWKGMRNVSLHFCELDSDYSIGQSVRPKLYLVIHAHLRGTLEVYRLRQGPRVAAAAVPDRNRCSVIECYGPPSNGSNVQCFLYEVISGTDQNGSPGRQCILDYIVIDEDDSNPSQLVKHPSNPQSENSMQLNFLIQLLASDTNIKCNTQTILNTFKSIRALSDLGDGLDALSKSQKMEQLGAEGSSFHAKALEHCKSRLESAVDKEQKEGSGLLQKSVISNLSSKISYHEKLVHAFDVLHRYELRSEDDDMNNDEYFMDSEPLGAWSAEAISWISIAEEHGIFTATATKHREDFSKPLVFSKFAMACSPPNPKSQMSTRLDGVILTEVKRDRLPLLMRLFRPLLEDLFVFKVVQSVMANLGIYQNLDIQQQYFGEWFSTLSSYDIAQSNLSGAWRPMFRWLQDLILLGYDAHERSPNAFDEIQLQRAVRLQSLLDFCNEMEDLTKAFLLAVICMDAVSAASKQVEEKTYGKIIALECIQPWEYLLRKLRVLMLVTFRLSGDVHAVGPGIIPMTLKNISEFSTYYWVARDELSQSHDNQVIMALEGACLTSSVAFYPSSSDADSQANKKIILQSCSYTKKNSIINPSGLTNDSVSRPLLFYFRDHATRTTHLAAHRALILGKLWGQAPSKIDLLRDAVSTLHVVYDKFEPFSLATAVEFYQACIRSTCHAMMFGFLDGNDDFKEIMSPLVDDDMAWRYEFLSIAKKVLSLIIRCTKKHLGTQQSYEPTSNDSPFNIAEMWPPLQNE